MQSSRAFWRPPCAQRGVSTPLVPGPAGQDGAAEVEGGRMWLDPGRGRFLGLPNSAWLQHLPPQAVCLGVLL